MGTRRGKRPPNPYKSWLEYDLHHGPLADCKYEPTTLKYALPKEYTPDFVSPDGKIWYEAKGRIREYDELKKYLWINEVLEKQGKQLVFILAAPSKRAYPQCKRRRDGTYYSLADWCNEHGFKWYSAKDFGGEGR